MARTAVAGVQFKLMPSGVDVDFARIKKDVENTLKKVNTAVLNSIEEQPIAFGLKALIVTFALSESEEVDLVQNSLSKIEDVSSVELLDYRRAVG